MRIVVYIVITIVVIVGLYLLHRLAVQLETRKLRNELEVEQRKVKALRQEVAQAHSTEPEKMQLLRKELMAYDGLVDAIQDELVAPATLQLSDHKERISNLIVLHRPQRTF